MQRALLAVGLALLAWPAAAARKQDPVSMVVTLIEELKAKLEADGKMEQKSYDKYACWCEKTLERKAKDISDAKARIEELQARILELTGKTAATAVDTKQLEKDIEATKAAIADATALREKENGEYQAEKLESEQCIGALEAAVKALTGAGAQKGFLQSMHDAQLLSIAGGVKGILDMPPVEQALSGKDLQVVRRFVDHPDDFMRTPTQALLQDSDSNPFGDYAPQSSQIQGILKGMYDTFASSLEKANGEEADKQKSFEEFLATKEKELETLEEAHLRLSQSQAEMLKTLADSKQELDDTKVQLEADEKFFAETKEACKAKATEWADRSRMRTTEMAGINKAIEILTGPEAKKIFEASRTTLLQLIAQPHHGKKHEKASRSAYDQLKRLASHYNGVGLAQIAAALRTGGHFDEIIVMIDKMIADMRTEEKEDIAHRDRCQVATTKTANDGEDLGGDNMKAESELGRLQDELGAAKKELEGVGEEIAGTEKAMAERLELRNEESKEFTQALKDDADAVAVLGQAIVALTKFYHDNKLPLELAQEPEYTTDQDKAPETSWKGDYGGAKSESGGIISILEMLKEDIANEMVVGREEDAKAQKGYEEDRATMQSALDKQRATELSLKGKVAELDGKVSDMEAHIEQLGAEIKQNGKLAETLGNDCEWVETHFDSRKEKRAAEIQGLEDAKNILAGAASGDGEDLN